MAHPINILISGLNSFTGLHLQPLLKKSFPNANIVGLESDITIRKNVMDEIESVKPDYLIHLAGISHAGVESNEIYNVNVIGTTNLLDGLLKSKSKVKKVILASSATVYGNADTRIISEHTPTNPINHYGCSKLAMEQMSKNYQDIPIIITRPFNYTGTGHSDLFLVPKIINAYINKKNQIDLGNLDVSREFNDVRDICESYVRLMISDFVGVVNICSGTSVNLKEIIKKMDDISGYKIKIIVNPKFVRKNEIKHLSGNPQRLQKITGKPFLFNIDETLSWMYFKGNNNIKYD